MKHLKTFWDEACWFYCELKKTFSNTEKSFFSSKRIERGMLFVTALLCSNYWFWTHVGNLSYEKVIAFVAAHLGFAGYTMYQTQKEKKPQSNGEK